MEVNQKKISKERDVESGCCKEVSCCFVSVVWKLLPDKVRPRTNERESHADNWDNKLGRQSSMCKGPESRMGSVCARNSKDANVS